VAACIHRKEQLMVIADKDGALRTKSGAAARATGGKQASWGEQAIAAAPIDQHLVAGWRIFG
jgi:hypothetical protein